MTTQPIQCAVCGVAVEPMLTSAIYRDTVLCDPHAVEAGYCPECGDLMGSDPSEQFSLDTYGRCSDCRLNDETETAWD